jgi:hypothetical protein
VDDIVVHNGTGGGYYALMGKVFIRLERNNMKVNKKRIQFSQKDVKLLGVKVNGRKKIPAEVKKNEMLEFPSPRTIREPRGFLGLARWFGEFIKGYAETTKVLYESSKGENEWEWTDEMGRAFRDMKNTLREANKLKLPELVKRFTLKTDRIKTGLGAVLLQENVEGNWVTQSNGYRGSYRR